MRTKQAEGSYSVVVGYFQPLKNGGVFLWVHQHFLWEAEKKFAVLLSRLLLVNCADSVSCEEMLERGNYSWHQHFTKVRKAPRLRVGVLRRCQQVHRAGYGHIKHTHINAKGRILKQSVIKSVWLNVYGEIFWDCGWWCERESEACW